jgi:tRNA threonylcarbamoyladenosine modification (KEOPS) complex Cgi121 subunit
MIMQKFQTKISKNEISYFVGYDQVYLDIDKYKLENQLKTNEKVLQKLISQISQIQNQFEGVNIQLLDHSYLLNQRHLFLGCYFMQKAFKLGLNISNKRNIELLLYLAGKRQIKRALKAFGLKIAKLDDKPITFCILSPKNNLNDIRKTIQQIISNHFVKHIDISDLNLEKLERIRNFFNFNLNQLQVLSNSYNFNFKEISKNEQHLENYAKILGDLISEKMSKLSLEKI